MAWIKTIPFSEARGVLKKEFEAALKRAGRIWHIVQVMSLNPRVLKSSMEFYSAVMMGSSPLSRCQREMLAVVVSAANHCVY
ncbi:MAG: hypothetical protein Kow0080_13670 [Candidatus Promineifilaceae bacterium]